VKATGIFYVLALVSDLARSKAFYGDKIGWKLTTDETRVAGFAFGAGYLVLHVDERRGDQRRYGGGMNVAVQVEDAAVERARLEKLGVPVSALMDQPWGERNFNFTDPDGYVWLVGQPLRRPH
jgi:catechol 2,3-dioxygenase-like lactoylglutathione lyase family enzyme